MGLGVDNGMAFGTDGCLYVIDTLTRSLLAFLADITAGTLGEPVIISDYLDERGKPDSMIAMYYGSF